MIAESSEKGRRAIEVLREAGAWRGLSYAVNVLNDAGLLPAHPSDPTQVVLRFDLGGEGFFVATPVGASGDATSAKDAA